MAPTPFLDDDEVDHSGLASAIDYYLNAGSSGILLLGVWGEADRLSDRERDDLVESAADQVQGRCALTVGVSAVSTAVTVAQAIRARAAGAAALMVAPPRMRCTFSDLQAHFSRLAEVGLPIVVQDRASPDGVALSSEELVHLLDDLPRGSVAKVEDAPTAPKIASLVAAGRSAFGGLGGLWLIEELWSGASGAMTGFAFPRTLVDVISIFDDDRGRAEELYCDALPLLAFESQPDIGLAIRKEFLRRLGVIRSGHVRRPGRPLDAVTAQGLERLLGQRPRIVDVHLEIARGK